jgi:predicted ArsR family transcriptional regulator
VFGVTGNLPTQDIAAVQLLDEPVRRRLYEWVVAQGRPVGRDESAQALGIKRTLATFHLDRLAAAGLLEAGYQRLTDKRGPGAGRPARIYWRSEREFNVSLPDRSYDRMAEVFAEALESMPNEAQRPLHDAAVRAGEALVSQVRAEPGVGRLLTVLNEGGYEPSVDEDGTIRLRNCPFHSLIDAHQPLVCGANLAMAEGMVHASGADSDVSPVLDPQPGYCCVVFKP